MIDISAFINCFLRALDESFGERVWFVGLQGSYGRGEASETSDIDLVVILDKLTPADIAAYDEMLNTLPHRDRLCGFLGGKDELLHWEPSDLFQFYHDTKPIRGTLDELLPLLDGQALDRAIRIGACGLYHACVHNMLYEKSEEVLRSLYKSASFIIQAISFRQTGKYLSRQEELLSAVAPEQRSILAAFSALKRKEAIDFQEASAALFEWSKAWIR